MIIVLAVCCHAQPYIIRVGLPVLGHYYYRLDWVSASTSSSSLKFTIVCINVYEYKCVCVDVCRWLTQFHWHSSTIVHHIIVINCRCMWIHIFVGGRFLVVSRRQIETSHRSVVQYVCVCVCVCSSRFVCTLNCHQLEIVLNVVHIVPFPFVLNCIDHSLCIVTIVPNVLHLLSKVIFKGCQRMKLLYFWLGQPVDGTNVCVPWFQTDSLSYRPHRIRTETIEASLSLVVADCHYRANKKRPLSLYHSLSLSLSLSYSFSCSLSYPNH